MKRLSTEYNIEPFIIRNDHFVSKSTGQGHRHRAGVTHPPEPVNPDARATAVTWKKKSPGQKYR